MPQRLGAAGTRGGNTRKIRWGVLSTARIGIAKVIPGMQQGASCDVTAIASRDIGRAREAAARLAIPKAYGNYEDLLGDPDIDAVYIPLPNHLHAPWTIAAARSGKHVLCEKPLALGSAEAAEMVDACRQAKVRLMEAFMYRLHPQWVKIREILESGRLGRLTAIQSFFSYKLLDPKNIRNIPEYGGGSLMDIGCYCVNLSRMLFGQEPRRVRGSLYRDPGLGVDILSSGILEFEAGHSTFTCATQAEPHQRVLIIGTEGRLQVETPFNIPPDYPTRLHLTIGGTFSQAGETEVLVVPAADKFTIQGDLFSQAILKKRPVPIPPQDAIANMQVMEELLSE
jgi:predicted dehydrogenase